MFTATPSLKITLLAGGPSAERDVSLATGAAVERALTKLGHELRVIDPDKDLFNVLTPGSADLVFIALHGTLGEDGVLQGCLDWLGIPYTGSSLKSSAIAMDKAISRTLFQTVGVPVADGLIWHLGTPLPTQEQLPKGPWIVKPTNEGSSVGLDRCDHIEALYAVLDQKTSHGPQEWLIESYLSGTEVSVVVFNGEVWGSVEISPREGIYDYKAKYVSGDTEYFCPPRLSQETIERLETYAVLAYQVLECRGVCRVDFITDQQRDIALELNTLPGMTATSLVPKVAASRGISFDSLIAMIIEDAMKAHRSD